MSSTTILIILAIFNAGLLLMIFYRKSGPSADMKAFSKDQDRLEKVVKDEFARNRKESSDSGRQSREEISKSLKSVGDSLDKRLVGMSQTQIKTSQNLVKAVEQKLTLLQKDNTTQLDKMRETVDEKLQSTLEKRLGESFKQVSDRLEQVHKGLGEMQTLATGVGDLKKVLTNVKTRGTWGEIQLENLLEQILTKDQYSKNVEVKRGSGERVEFGIKIPAKDSDNKNIWLPIDAKFPLEDYQRLIKAQEAGNTDDISAAQKALHTRIKDEAKKIKEKYIDPPNTTDFAVLYLPIEGLYAEITQHPELAEKIQRTYRVAIGGPNTIAALLNSLQMGFRTLAIQKRTSQVWEVLGAVRTEFNRFGDILDKTKQKLEQATTTIDKAASKSRTIERKLNKVQSLSEPEDTKGIDIQIGSGS